MYDVLVEKAILETVGLSVEMYIELRKLELKLPDDSDPELLSLLEEKVLRRYDSLIEESFPSVGGTNKLYHEVL